jgi:hypothetical protein
VVLASTSTIVPVNFPSWVLNVAPSAAAGAYCAFAYKWRVVVKSISTPPFSRRWEHFPNWKKCSDLFNYFINKKQDTIQKKGGLQIFPPGLYGGLYGQNQKFEKLHRTIYWSPVRYETGFVILSQFWSRYDLQNFQNRKCLGDDQGELSKGTVHLIVQLY